MRTQILMKIKKVAARLCVPYCPGDKIIMACDRYINLNGLIKVERTIEEIEHASSSARDYLAQIDELVADIKKEAKV